MSTKPLVFVYGSLKAGFHNHALLEKHETEYVGTGLTIESKFHMFSCLSSFPAVVLGGSYKIKGELYRVSFECLRDLDTLEGNGILYTRSPFMVMSERSGVLDAWMYVQDRAKHDASYRNRAEKGFRVSTEDQFGCCPMDKSRIAVESLTNSLSWVAAPRRTESVVMNRIKNPQQR